MNPTTTHPAPATPERNAERTAALRHLRARWLGTAYLGLALALLGATGVAVFLLSHPWYDLLICLFGCGLGLATFGSHNDTGLARLRPLRLQVTLPPRIQRELDREFLYERLHLEDLSPTPRTAWVVTVAAPLVLAWGLVRLVG